MSSPQTLNNALNAAAYSQLGGQLYLNVELEI